MKTPLRTKIIVQEITEIEQNFVLLTPVFNTSNPQYKNPPNCKTVDAL